MEYTSVAAVFNSLCILRLASGLTLHGGCMLTRGRDVSVLAVRITRKGEKPPSSRLGLLVTRTRMLSRLSPFVQLAQDSSLLPQYECLSYDKDFDGDYCYQKSEATEFVPHRDWPRLSIDEVRDAALWKFDTSLNPFNVSENFPFLFPISGDRSKLSNAIARTAIGDVCAVQWLAEYHDDVTSTMRLLRWTDFGIKVSVLNDCEESFCKMGGVCNVHKRYDYCVFDEWRKQVDPREQLGGLLICHGTTIGALGIESKTKVGTTGLALFVNLLKISEAFERELTESAISESVEEYYRSNPFATAAISFSTYATKKKAATIATAPRRTTKSGKDSRRIEEPSMEEIRDNDDDDRYDDYDDDDDDGASSVVSAPAVLALFVAAFYENR